MNMLPVIYRKNYGFTRNIEPLIDAMCMMIANQQNQIEQLMANMNQQAPSSTIDEEEDLEVEELPKGVAAPTIMGHNHVSPLGNNMDKAIDSGVTFNYNKPKCDCGTTSHAHHINCPVHASNFEENK